MGYGNRFSTILLAGLPVVAFLGFIVLKDFVRIENAPNRELRTTHESDFQFLSSESTNGQPVFVSKRFHFRYTPTGNYGYSVDGPREKMLKEISVTSNTQPATHGLSLLIYKSDDVSAAHDVTRFRNWRKENIYNDDQDEISVVTLSGFKLWKATQTDGIASSSTYYYLVQPDYTYVFLSGLEQPDEAMTQVLANFSLN